MKFSRDPITGYPTVTIGNTEVVIQKESGTPEEIMNQPAQEVIECAL